MSAALPQNTASLEQELVYVCCPEFCSHCRAYIGAIWLWCPDGLESPGLHGTVAVREFLTGCHPRALHGEQSEHTPSFLPAGTSLTWGVGFRANRHLEATRVPSRSMGWAVPAPHSPSASMHSLPERSLHIPMEPKSLLLLPGNSSRSPDPSGQQGLCFWSHRTVHSCIPEECSLSVELPICLNLGTDWDLPLWDTDYLGSPSTTGSN